MWIKCEDRLPPEDTPVLVCMKEHPLSVYLACIFYIGEGWMWGQYSGFGSINDTGAYEVDDDYLFNYWMEIPNPPVEE